MQEQASRIQIQTEPVKMWDKSISCPTRLPLANGEIHIWQVSLDAPAALQEELVPYLSGDERERAARFHFERDRNRWTVARGWLRLCLARYLDIEPRQLAFACTQYGKPRLTEPANADSLHFNLSHSDRVALLAVVQSREIGADVERIRRDFPCLEVALHFFSPSERETLAVLPERQQHEAFFNCWTRKEAYIKARGEGLSLPLHQFDVSLGPGEPARLLRTRPDPNEAGHWSLRELETYPGYAAALAVEAPIRTIRYFMDVSDPLYSQQR